MRRGMSPGVSRSDISKRKRDKEDEGEREREEEGERALSECTERRVAVFPSRETASSEVGDKGGRERERWIDTRAWGGCKVDIYRSRCRGERKKNDRMRRGIYI